METTKTEQFMRLFVGNERKLYGLIVSLVPNLSDADDLLQESLTLIWRKFDSFEMGTDFAAWASQFARFAVLKHYEKKRTAGKHVLFNTELIELLAEEEEQSTVQPDARQEAMRGCLRKLPRQSRQMIKLRYETGATARSVAAQIGLSVNVVYKAMSRAHDQLLHCIRRALAEEGRT